MANSSKVRIGKSSSERMVWMPPAPGMGKGDSVDFRQGSWAPSRGRKKLSRSGTGPRQEMLLSGTTSENSSRGGCAKTARSRIRPMRVSGLSPKLLRKQTLSCGCCRSPGRRPCCGLETAAAGARIRETSADVLQILPGRRRKSLWGEGAVIPERGRPRALGRRPRQRFASATSRLRISRRSRRF